MEACAVLFLLSPKFPFSRRTSPASYLCVVSSFINVVSMLYGLLSGRNVLCPKKRGK